MRLMLMSRNKRSGEGKCEEWKEGRDVNRKGKRKRKGQGKREKRGGETWKEEELKT